MNMKHNIVLISAFLTLGIITACTKNYVISDEVLATEKGLLHEEESDYVWNESDEIDILLNGNSISCSSGQVIVSGSIATITDAGTYRISGTLTDGQLIVNATETELVRLIFDGININCSNNAPLYIQNALKLIVNLPIGSVNYLSDGTQYQAINDEPNATFYCQTDLTIYGEGSLNIDANFNDGITSKDGFLLKSGQITIDSKDDGIRGKDFLIIRDVDVTIQSGGDGLKSDDESGYVLFEAGKVNISAGDDGIDASKTIRINDTELTINQSVEGIESESIIVNSGIVIINASDDGFNATTGEGGEESDGSLLQINGGTVVVNCTTGDGLDSNGDISISGGKIIVHGPSRNPEVGMDYNGTCNVTGGFLVVSGTNSNMVQGPSTSSSQYGLKLITTSSISASTLIHIAKSDGTEILSFKPKRAYSSIIFSSSALESGSTYSIYTGGSSSGTEYYGLFEGGDYSSGTLYKTFTVSSLITSIGSASGGGGPR